MKHCRQFAILAILLMCVRLSLSQTASTSVRGTITDPSGAVVAGAEVTLRSEANAVHISHPTDANGAYTFPQIPAGTYTIVVKSAGFAEQSKKAELLVNQPATINFQMSVTATTSTVDVSATAETLNNSDATIGNAVGNQEIQALPMEGRNVPDLLSLQPGVVYLGHTDNQDQDSRSGAVAGARSDQSNVTLDGVDDNDQTKGYAFQGVLRSTLDSVEEFRVTTTNANADSGRSSGAQVVMVTKSGTDKFHGSLYEYNRNTDFAANDWFNKQAQLAGGEPNKPGELIRNTFGASLGGPIAKGKLFFFINYEGQHTAENQQATLTVPTASLRAGSLQYVDQANALVTLDPQQIAGMDPQCTANNTCPWGPGGDPYMITQLNQYPMPNGFEAGDGLNTASFTWSAPNPITLNTYIAKLDYLPSQNNRIFVRGNLMGDRTSGVPQFPGDPPSYVQVNTSKGVAAGDVWTINSSLINNLRYGYIRQQLDTPGAGNQNYVDPSDFSTFNAENRSTLVTVPVHNVSDDFTWVKGSHTLQFGGNWRLIHNDTQSNATSFFSAQLNPGGLYDGGISDKSTPGNPISFDPSGFGYPLVNYGFTYSYDEAAEALAGVISNVSKDYNYQVGGSTTASLLPWGDLVTRNFKSNEFEWYVQDAWRIKPNLTFTYGLRYTLLQTPYEVNGQQVAPNVDIHQWFETRAQQMLLGNTVEPDFSFAPSGQARGGQPYWPANKNNFAPRLAVAYSPAFTSGILHTLFGGAGMSSIRAGAGLYYDHFGEGIVSQFSQLGSFGLSSDLISPGNTYTMAAGPRYTGINNVPNVIPAPVQNQTYPVLPPDTLADGGYAYSVGMDNHLQTPRSIVADLSLQRQLPKGFTLEAAYVGRFGRHLLQLLDIAQPLDLVDPKSGQSYYGAAAYMDRAELAGATTVAPLAYWEDLFPAAAGNGNSATQNIYNSVPNAIWSSNPGNDAGAIYWLDALCLPAYPGNTQGACGGKTNRYWDPQYSSLFAWSSIGNSSYNALQFILRHPSSHGLQFDFSYTYSHAIDLGSDAERSTCSCVAGTGSFSPILSTFDPKGNRGSADFDTRHLITGNWVYELPVGKGKAFATGAGGWLNGVIGGWQLSGLTRWTSGFPFSVQGISWPTDWVVRSYMVNTGAVQLGKHVTASGAPQVFADPAAIQSGIVTGSPMRDAFAGEAGQRNVFHGDGYFGVDAGLAKSWHIGEHQAVKFAWEVFNVTNSVRFDVNPNTSFDNVVADGSFGQYKKTLTTPRVQQFSLRYSF
jgi:hypothetical protein